MGFCESWATEFGPSAVEYESTVVIWPWSLFRRYGQASNFGSIAQPSQSPLTLWATLYNHPN